MRGMILAAGRGERMGELTLDRPKPLLRVGGHYLIEYAIHNMKRAGILDIVINVSYHADQVKAALGNGEQFGVNILYSEEKKRLEVGGGIFQALPLLGNQPFIVISSDIITDFPLATLMHSSPAFAHLVMVDNPAFHPQGDFGLHEGYIDKHATPTFTFANMGLYHPAVFAGCEPGYFRWSHALLPAIEKGLVTGEHYRGLWYNVGTPSDLQEVNQPAFKNVILPLLI